MQARVSRDDGFSFYNFPDGRYYKVIIDRAVHLVFFQNSVLINDLNKNKITPMILADLAIWMLLLSVILIVVYIMIFI